MTVRVSTISVEMIGGEPHLSWTGNVSERDLAIARKWAVIGYRRPKESQPGA